MGKGRCARVPHPAVQHFMDNNMHDLKLERFYKVGQVFNDSGIAARRSDQDLHPARHQGLAAVPA